MEQMTFSFADLITGYVTQYNPNEKSFGLKTSDGREYKAYISPAAYAQITRNLGEGWRSAEIERMLVPGQHVFAYGVFYPKGDGHKFEVKSIVFPGESPDKYRHEEQDWWINQVRSIAECYLRWQFGYPENPVDYREYRTMLKL